MLHYGLIGFLHANLPQSNVRYFPESSRRTSPPSESIFAILQRKIAQCPGQFLQSKQFSVVKCKHYLSNELQPSIRADLEILL